MTSCYPLAVSSWDDEEIDILRNLTIDQRFTMGDCVKRFESNFARFTGSKHAVMVNSGSSANLLAVAALVFSRETRIKRGDEVIVPAVSWGTTYFPLQQYGLHLKFVDIDPHTLNMDMDLLKSAISSKTKLVVAVNLLGNPNQFDMLDSMCREHNILLIEDNCESMGAKFGNRNAGTFGKLGTFSTYFSHHISTIEGGMVVTDDEELYHIMLSMRSHGWTRSLPEINKVTVKGEREFEESFRFVLPGYNLRPSELTALLGEKQLSKLPGFIENRRENACYFRSLFSNHPLIRIQKEIGESSWFGFSLVLTGKLSAYRNKLVDFLQGNAIECRPIVAGNFVKNDVIKYFDYEISGDLRVADEIDSCGLYIGNHHFSLKKEVDYFHNKLTEFIEKI